MEEKNKNIFTDLFPKKTGSSDTFIKSVNASTNVDEILKPVKSDDELIVYKKPTLGLKLLQAAIVIGVLMVGYFHFQLTLDSSLLGENPVTNRSHLYEKTLKSQAEINMQNYVLLKYALDEFLFTADTYMHKAAQYRSTSVAQSKKVEIDKDLPALRNEMKQQLLFAQSILSKNLIPELLPVYWETGDYRNMFVKATKDLIRSNIESASNDKDQAEFLRAVSRLLDSTAISEVIMRYDVPTMNDTDFAKAVKELNATDTGAFATLNTIREHRIAWTKIIQEMERVTKTIDPLFATKILSQKVGNIFYTSYALDRKSGLVSVVGETVSDDGSNFTLSANLIDAFESSKLFEEVSMNSFTKTKKADEGYVGVLNLQFKLSEQ